jgi:hypothetical protein
VEKRVESGRGRVRLDWLLGQMVSSLLVIGGGYGRIRRDFERMDAVDGMLRWWQVRQGKAAIFSQSSVCCRISV